MCLIRLRPDSWPQRCCCWIRFYDNKTGGKFELHCCPLGSSQLTVTPFLVTMANRSIELWHYRASITNVKQWNGYCAIDGTLCLNVGGRFGFGFRKCTHLNGDDCWAIWPFSLTFATRLARHSAVIAVIFPSMAVVFMPVDDVGPLLLACWPPALDDGLANRLGWMSKSGSTFPTSLAGGRYKYSIASI